MRQGDGKKEIVQHINELVAQLKNGTYHSPFGRQFAEVTVENRKGAESGGKATESEPLTLLPPDKKRNRFLEMRKLARFAPSADYPAGSGDTARATLFYKQAKFMEDFEDDYEGNAPFSLYFPSYQLMSCEQLRTYFTWRSGVRRGDVRQTSFSYVFLYLYELINNVGVRDCEDGLAKLASVWEAYRPYEKKLDRYMNAWVRDYYITNDFTEPFESVLGKTGNLAKLYRPSGAENFFDFYRPYSDYKIEKSIFFTGDAEKAIRACFCHVVRSLDGFLRRQGAEFEDLVFYSKSNAWVPFSKALYCPFSRPVRNKAVRLSETQKYKCLNGRWTSSESKIPKENGRAILGFLLRRIEQFFRTASGFKYKLTANRDKVSAGEIAQWFPERESFFAAVDAAIAEYYRESRRKTVTVDPSRLEEIRANARKTQELLLADAEADGPGEEEPAEEPEAVPPAAEKPPASPEAKPAAHPAQAAEDPWAAFARSLDETEKDAVRLALRDAPPDAFRTLSKESGVMPEVLADGINQKAIGTVGDDVMELSGRAAIFEEYREDLKRVIGFEQR